MASHNRATKLQYYKPALLQSKIAQALVQWHNQAIHWHAISCSFVAAAVKQTLTSCIFH